MSFRKTKNLKKVGQSDKNGGKNVRKPKQKVQSQLRGKMMQKKQTFAKKVSQIKTQTSTRPPQKSSYPSKATTPIMAYRKQVPFNDAHMDARIRRATMGSKGKSTGKAKLETSNWPDNTTR